MNNRTEFTNLEQKCNLALQQYAVHTLNNADSEMMFQRNKASGIKHLQNCETPKQNVQLYSFLKLPLGCSFQRT